MSRYVFYFLAPVLTEPPTPLLRKYESQRNESYLHKISFIMFSGNSFRVQTKILCRPLVEFYNGSDRYKNLKVI